MIAAIARAIAASAIARLPLPLLRLRLPPYRQPPDVDEPRRRRPVELVCLIVRRQREVVQALRRLPPHNRGRALVQLYAHRTRDVTLSRLHVGRQVLGVG